MCILLLKRFGFVYCPGNCPRGNCPRKLSGGIVGGNAPGDIVQDPSKRSVSALKTVELTRSTLIVR